MPNPNAEARRQYAREYGWLHSKSNYEKRRASLLTRLGSKCQFCDQATGLTVFHRDTEEPDPVPLGSFWGWSEEFQAPHLEKLMLLCGQHKRKTGVGRKAGQVTHGTYFSVQKKKCTCQECLIFLESYNAARKLKRQQASAAAGIGRVGRADKPNKTVKPRAARVRAAKSPKQARQPVASAAKLIADRADRFERIEATRAPHGSWHVAINLKCRCEACKAFLKDLDDES